MLGLWWTLLPTIGAMAIVAILPTCLWVRAWVKSSVVAVGVAPAITFAIIMGLSVLFDAANVPWEKAKVFPILGLLSALGAITWLFVEARRSGGGSLQPGGIVASLGPRRPLGELQSRVRASTWGMIAVGTLLAALPMLTNADPRMPAQQWDSTFHLNGVWSMLSTRVASPFGGIVGALRRSGGLLPDDLARLRGALRHADERHRSVECLIDPPHGGVGHRGDRLHLRSDG